MRGTNGDIIMFKLQIEEWMEYTYMYILHTHLCIYVLIIQLCIFYCNDCNDCWYHVENIELSLYTKIHIFCHVLLFTMSRYVFFAKMLYMFFFHFTGKSGNSGACFHPWSQPFWKHDHIFYSNDKIIYLYQLCSIASIFLCRQIEQPCLTKL